ncbi:hypothetical protein EK21DRAFT_108478 [Setomelanomma holmii]|uniref:receptor protein-tyrosine kinase n=1 Tax=Setomelanomma holmii TaxID=210430 RepID=A0A9P4LST0_9PLEO|nr:hypothetical protein EK21DRAFT_108478 [Setomelanomma holmii]
MDWGCTCSSGLKLVEENLRQFNDTLPSQMCFTWYDQCISASGSDVSEQSACQQARDANCGRNATRLLGVADISSSSLRAASTLAVAISSLRSASSGTRSTAPAETSQPANIAVEGDASVGVIAGCVIGGIVGIVIILFALFCFRRRRRARKGAKALVGSPRSRDDEKEVVIPFATDISHKPELHSHDRPHELEAPIHQHELETNAPERLDGQ